MHALADGGINFVGELLFECPQMPFNSDLANMLGESDAALLGLHNFTYDNHQLLERIFSHLSSTDYNGIVVTLITL